ncbi:polygalacturonase inhibitor 2-like [Salvia miltiorrhiza]|uniref:polygalacturonase inhibitor 2-like n=1 Tax=Salvia miltiorrhiza TaxID=226208 RepID=UPI0025AB6FEA|nr:polygalacturonase inhibitor 2-like [Salvia miltiorrhiza]
MLFFLFVSLSVSVSEKCHPDDKKVLLQIKKELHNPSDLASWNPKTDCCQWTVVGCGGKANRITVFHFSEANLKRRPIPAAVGDLPYLQSLTFRNTNVTGLIPTTISNLSDLFFLNLEYNLLTGPLPAFLTKLKKLQFLLLSYNRLTGSIPPSLSQLPKLKSLLLDGNRLTGAIPETFADFRNHQIYLFLSYNQLSGPIPSKLGNANFSEIHVSGNNLEGDISFLFGKSKRLAVGDFSRNHFHFDLSNLHFSDSLTNLDLSQNKIYGSIPKDLSSTGIIMLNVSYNSLCGPIPELGTFQTFDYTSFIHNKCLCGKPLPACK